MQFLYHLFQITINKVKFAIKEKISLNTLNKFSVENVGIHYAGYCKYVNNNNTILFFNIN